MNEDLLNASIRKFLKTFGVTAQREIEKAVRQAANEGRLPKNQPLQVRATLNLDKIGLVHSVEDHLEVD